MKSKLLTWVDDRIELDGTSTLILLRLASFADAENVGWSAVKTLAKLARCSERTVQSRLRMLEAEGYIQPTGRYHTTDGKHPREIPTYRIGPRELRAGYEEISGANSAPETNLGCKPDQSGVQLVSPRKEPIEPTSGANAPSERVREREAQFIELEAAVPQAMLATTDRDRAWRAFVRLADQGVDLAKLVEAGRRLAADPKIRKRDYSLVGMDRWLEQGRYRGHWPEEAAAVAQRTPSAFAAPGGRRASKADQEAWDKVAAKLRKKLGDDAFGSWLGHAYLGDADDGAVLVAATGTAKDWISAKAWKQAQELWAEAAPEGRTLRLMSKREFEVAR